MIALSLEEPLYWVVVVAEDSYKCVVEARMCASSM